MKTGTISRGTFGLQRFFKSKSQKNNNFLSTPKKKTKSIKQRRIISLTWEYELSNQSEQFLFGNQNIIHNQFVYFPSQEDRSCSEWSISVKKWMSFVQNICLSYSHSIFQKSFTSGLARLQTSGRYFSHWIQIYRIKRNKKT